MASSTLLRIGVLASALLVSACTIVRVDSVDDPPRIESRGLIDGHMAFGLPAEDHLLHADLFDGTSKGAIGELVIWKLLRLEVGLAGASIGVGPFHLGLGLGFYKPRVPPVEGGRKRTKSPAVEEHPVQREYPVDTEFGDGQ